MEEDEEEWMDELDARHDEGRKVNVKKSPETPSRREVEGRQRAHLPFRDRCGRCIKSKGGSRQHTREADEMRKRRGCRERIGYDSNWLWALQQQTEENEPEIICRGDGERQQSDDQHADGSSTRQKHRSHNDT